MVEPCEDPVALESITPEPSPLESYQWKKRSMWDRLQEWKSSRGSQNKQSQKKQMHLFKKIKPSKESNGGIVHYLRSVSLHQKGRKKEVIETVEVLEGKQETAGHYINMIIHGRLFPTFPSICKNRWEFFSAGDIIHFLVFIIMTKYVSLKKCPRITRYLTNYCC